MAAGHLSPGPSPGRTLQTQSHPEVCPWSVTEPPPRFAGEEESPWRRHPIEANLLAQVRGTPAGPLRAGGAPGPRRSFPPAGALWQVWATVRGSEEEPQGGPSTASHTARAAHASAAGGVSSRRTPGPGKVPPARRVGPRVLPDKTLLLPCVKVAEGSGGQTRPWPPRPGGPVGTRKLREGTPHAVSCGQSSAANSAPTRHHEWPGDCLPHPLERENLRPLQVTGASQKPGAVAAASLPGT